VSLTLHRAERSDVLVRRLAAVLADVPVDPFSADVVAVPSKGVERWIAQSLSASLGAADGGDGVCANVVFPSPGRLVRDALAAASDVAVEEDPWDASRLPWPLLEVIDTCATEPWCRTLGRHLGLLGGGLNRGRRMAVAQKLARLFTAYGAERPTMLLAWRISQDTDGYGDALPPDLRWQAELWRRVRAQIGLDSPAERLQPACSRLRSQPDLVDLPKRISIFGPTRLTTSQLAVVDALAEQRDVHLWLPHPSDGLWQRLAEARELDLVPTRPEDSTSAVPDHPLLRSLGRDARELQLRLRTNTAPEADAHVAAPTTPSTLLGALQRDLHADRRPDGSHVLADGDISVQVHGCHGRHRQVEVLREVLLGVLDDDPTLELRDIIVMCPDIEAYAPLLSASFGVEIADEESSAEPRPEVHPGHRLTFRLADRSLRQTNPVLGVAARLLDLADSRLTASEVLDLMAMPPLRRRFRLDDDALERVGDWVRRAGVRWGLDAHGRAAYGLGGIRQNTWEHGLDRVLAGVAMDEEELRTVGTSLPLDDVDSAEIDLAGRLAELVERLDAALDSLRHDQSLEKWATALDAAVDSLVDVAPGDAWQVTQAKATLANAVAAAGDQASGAALRLSDIRALLGDRLKGRPTRANFRTGHLTICTMVPMRSVPHRVVCLLGLDDGVFPRDTHIDGDDILARSPRVGERDRRSEDRQLFLDAILAAKERLVILYTGADERTGATRPPAVPLGELLDVLDRTAMVGRSSAMGGETRVSGRVRVRHPLQPFDARNFQAGELLEERPFSFDRASYAGSRALRDGQTAVAPFLPGPLPAVGEDEPVQLERLIRFFEHPVRQFLQQRLDLRSANEDEPPSDQVPVAPDALELYQVGERLLQAGLGRRSVSSAVEVELLRGELPPGRLGVSAVQPLLANVDALLTTTAGLRSGDADTFDVSVDLPSGVTMAGTVPQVYGTRPVRIQYAKLSAKHRIRAWVQLLALTAADPDRPWWTATVGRGKGSAVSGSFVRDVAREDALRYLDDLVWIYRLGLTRPLPIPPKTSCGYATCRFKDVPVPAALTLAAREWTSTSSKTGETWGEHKDDDHRRVGLVTFQDLVREPAHAVPLDNPRAEPYLFGLLATRIWTPLLSSEDLRT
jgi:exodeoxyribonuclease V gamma subunit